ncbi:restriction endonuclease subunit S [Nitrosomonas ureae]|uniref:Type I restriction enzyme S subunit n=1 Tax=Nitrosomonas ureae TaxID=44577 RepID=A0A2T5IVW6_9PROT|nr:restriction endonuclease subunit S [Nitrosomonas ureae]PTQ88027.1 type I restriction enzyme S subunit [Nitrosomonas ureae]
MSAETPGIASDKKQNVEAPTSKTPSTTPTITIPPFEKGGLGGIPRGPGGIIPKEPEWIHHLDIWTTAETEKKSGRGRSSGNGSSVYGIQKLRELILELAVRGKLVPQDPNDEPAGELLKRIQAEKAKLVVEGKIKKEKPLPPISDEEKPFELPQGWEWVRIGSIGHDWGQKTPDSDFTYIEVSAIDSLLGIVSSPALVKPENAPSRARKMVKEGTVIYSTIRPYLLNIAVIEKEFLPEPIASTAFAIVHPFCSMPPRYFLCFFRSPVFVRYVESVQMGIAYPAINDGQFFSGLIPLPPIEEQHRIVAKVDELMTLCDQLETQHINAAEAHEKLVSHLLGTLTQSQSADDFSANWERIAAHFDTLFTTEASIDALKQTLLQLAVMGKLVPQDPNDEPASELLKRIQAEKAKLVAEGKIKKDKPLPPITEEEKPYELPQGWEWSRLSQIAIVISGNAFNSEDFNSQSGAKVIKITNAGVYEFIESHDYLPESFLSKYMAYLVKEGDLILALTRPYISTGLKISMCPPSYNNSLLNQRVAAIRVCIDIKTDYVFIFLKCPSILKFYQDSFGNSGLQPNLKVSDVTELMVAIPPLPEQHRIVTKVDELMALCDQLKSAITQASQLQKKLADVVVEQAIAS